MPESTFKTTLQHVALATAGFGALGLAHQIYEYRQFKKQMQQMIPAYSGDRPPPIEATEKEWLFIGRQSPTYVRDPGKHPKNHILKAISGSALQIRKLGTSLDNEKHYDLFVGSDFVVERCAGGGKKALITVRPEYMLATDVNKLETNTFYEINFARKQGFADISQRSPLYHSSLALREAPQGYSEPGAVILSGVELKAVFDETNKKICHVQHCDLYRSNCYTASIFALAQVIKEIDKRPRNEENDRLIVNASMVLAHAASENLGRGVANNSVVRAQLKDVLNIQVKRGLLPTLAEESASALEKTNQSIIPRS